MDAERRRAIAALLGAAATLRAGHAAAQPEADARRVEAARKEGKVVVYTAAVGQSAHLVVARAFEKAYGIPVTFLEARASEVRERVRTEQAAGRFLGDLSHNGSTTTALQLHEGAFQPHGGIAGTRRLRAPFAADDVRVPVFASAYAILVNTNLVTPADEPRRWADLTDPRWMGRILSDDMRALGGGAVAFFVLHDRLGRGFHEKLARNKPVWSRDQRASERRVARGEFPIWIPMTTNSNAALKGLPVKLVTPEEGYPYITYELALFRNAPHPNAARLLMQFFLSNEAQLLHDEQGLTMVTDVAAPAGTQEANAIRNGKLLGTTDAARQEAMLKLAQDIYR